MRLVGALLAAGLAASSADAQHIIPLGAPLLSQPKGAAAPPVQDQSSRLRATRPLGSNYSPYSIQPLGAVPTAAPSALPADKPENSGVVTDPNLVKDADSRKAARKPSQQQSDMQKLAPTTAERSDMGKAATDAPPKP